MPSPVSASRGGARAPYRLLARQRGIELGVALARVGTVFWLVALPGCRVCCPCIFFAQRIMQFFLGDNSLRLRYLLSRSRNKVDHVCRATRARRGRSSRRWRWRRCEEVSVPHGMDARQVEWKSGGSSSSSFARFAKRLPRCACSTLARVGLVRRSEAALLQSCSLRRTAAAGRPVVDLPWAAAVHVPVANLLLPGGPDRIHG